MYVDDGLKCPIGKLGIILKMARIKIVILNFKIWKTDKIFFPMKK
jgi:hypothetical protein